MKLKSLLALVSLTALTACGASVDSINGDLDQMLKTPNRNVQADCIAPKQRIGANCVESEREVGDFHLVAKAGQNSTQDAWYHAPSKILLTMPKPHESMLYANAVALCKASQTATHLPFTGEFTILSENELVNLVGILPLHMIYPAGSGHYWTSTADQGGWLSIVDLPTGSHHGEGSPAGYTAQVLCVAQLH